MNAEKLLASLANMGYGAKIWRDKKKGWWATLVNQRGERVAFSKTPGPQTTATNALIVLHKIAEMQAEFTPKKKRN